MTKQDLELLNLAVALRERDERAMLTLGSDQYTRDEKAVLACRYLTDEKWAEVLAFAIEACKAGAAQNEKLFADA